MSRLEELRIEVAAVCELWYEADEHWNHERHLAEVRYEAAKDAADNRLQKVQDAYDESRRLLMEEYNKESS